ncbi:MAG: class II aldolase/adducin family protein [Flavisolibacter sp.]
MKEVGIKFKGHWIKAEAPDSRLVLPLNQWRERLYQLALIGETSEGIGYGNISTRAKGETFIITGTATGKFRLLSDEHYTTVIDCNPKDNAVTARGPIMASSESMTHGVIYQEKKNVGAVFHVHEHQIWEKLLQTHPFTGHRIAYGTPEMAAEVKRLLGEFFIADQGLFAMGGHEDGIIAFGRTLDEAGELLLEQVHNFRS